MSFSNICTLRGIFGHLNLINFQSSGSSLEELLSYGMQMFSKKAEPKDLLEERLAFLTKSITKTLLEAGDRQDSAFHDDLSQIEAGWKALVERLHLDVPKEDYSAQLSELDDKMQQVWYRALGIDKDELYQEGFASARAQSLEYLTEIDSRGVIGWEKVDKVIRRIVELIHQNPHTYHYGESCSGHVHDFDGKFTLSSGYAAIGMDDSECNQHLTEELEALAKEMPNLQVKKAGYCNGVRILVGAFDHEEAGERGAIAKGKLAHQQLLPIEGKMIAVWQRIEEILERYASGFESPWDKDRTAIWVNPYDKERA